MRRHIGRKLQIFPSPLSFKPPLSGIGADIRKSHWVHTPIPLSSLPSHSLSYSLPFPSLPLSPSLPLEVGPLNTVRGLGKRCKLPHPVESRAKPQLKSNLMHFSLKIWICWHQFYQFSWESIDHSVCTNVFFDNVDNFVYTFTNNANYLLILICKRLHFTTVTNTRTYTW